MFLITALVSWHLSASTRPSRAILGPRCLLPWFIHRPIAATSLPRDGISTVGGGDAPRCACTRSCFSASSPNAISMTERPRRALMKEASRLSLPLPSGDPFGRPLRETPPEELIGRPLWLLQWGVFRKVRPEGASEGCFRRVLAGRSPPMPPGRHPAAR